MKYSSFILLFFIFAGQSLKAQIVFNYRGAPQSFTIPPCVYAVTVDVRGGEGQTTNASVSNPGKGGRVQASFEVTPGEVLEIYVGGAGAVGAGAWNGGGNPGEGAGYGGGGASDIRRGGNTLADRYIVAGGGGGTGGAWTATGNHGGQAGGLFGSYGFFAGSYDPDFCGSGGTDSSGGAAANSNGAMPGTPGNGGMGGTQGGGGGGGYYGGGGGSFGGGGGGSSYAYPTAINVMHTPAFQIGSGQVLLNLFPQGGTAPGPIEGPETSCEGSIAAYSVGIVPAFNTYTWTFPPGTVINSGQGTINVEVTVGNTSGVISVVASNACGSGDSGMMDFTVSGILLADAGPDTTICKGSSATLNAGGGSVYAWEPDSSLSCTDCPDPVATPDSTTSYVVTVTEGTCKGRDTVVVRVEECAGISAFGKDLHASVFPNPASETLYIAVSHPDLKVLDMQLLNMQGQLFYADQAKHINGVYRAETPVSSFPKGVYYLRLKTENFITVKKIIIE